MIVGIVSIALFLLSWIASIIGYLREASKFGGLTIQP